MPEPSVSHLVRALLRTRRTFLADVDTDAPAGPGGPGRVLVRSDLPGTLQLYELVADDRERELVSRERELTSGEREREGEGEGELIQLTSLPEPVATAEYVRGSRQAILAIDQGGNERHQLYALDIDAAAESPVTGLDRLRALTSDPRFGHHSAGVSPDGRSLAYVSNRANGVDFDLWLCELASGEHRLLYTAGAWLAPASGFSPDGRLVSMLRPGERPLDLDLVLVDVATGEATVPLPHPREAAIVGPPAWAGPHSFYASSNVGRDFAAIVHHDLASGLTRTVPGTGEAFDAEVVTSGDGGTVLVIEDRDGADVMQTVDPATGERGPAVALPEPGVTSFFFLAPPSLSVDGSVLTYSLTTPRRAGDVYSSELSTGVTRRLSRTRARLDPDDLVGPIDPDDLISPELGEVASFDGERIPLFVYRPRSGGAGPRSGGSRPPVVVIVHGGPESQAMRRFHPEIQALLAVGYGVVVPNVRGSTGYGKRYAALDDTTRRLDSVRDLAAVHGYLPDAGFDAGRAVLWGGSYGGYMVLAGLAFQPGLWAAGVDIVGVSNLVTFLENTSEYRRAHREREYGSLVHDRAFLVEASPLTHVDAIRAPLFVIHGRNDPRVPVGEAEQLIDSLRGRGVPCELLIYEDEGHGLARLENQLDAYPRAIGFLDGVLGEP